MKILELFCGTKSFSNAAESRGHTAITIDNNSAFNPTICADLSILSKRDIDKIVDYNFDIIWASPPCQSFSIASVSKHWSKDKTPKSMDAVFGLSLLENTLSIINIIQPKYWFIENPRGMMRKMPIMKDLHRKTITYCQYGDIRMKPTDIWTNAIDWQPRPMCKNGDNCHVAAPRGSRSGTQGLKDAKERGRIPNDLCLEIIEYCERTQKGI